MWLLLLIVLAPGAFAQLDQPAGREAFIAASIHYHEGSYDQSIAGHERTIGLHHEVPFSKIMIARLWALKGDLDRAMEVLDQAAEFEFVRFLAGNLGSDRRQWRGARNRHRGTG